MLRAGIDGRGLGSDVRGSIWWFVRFGLQSRWNTRRRAASSERAQSCASTMNMCSKCHKEMIMKQEQAKLAASSIDSIVNGCDGGKGPVGAASTEVAIAQVEAKTLVVQPTDVAGTSEGVAVNPKENEGPNRCATCRKRVGLTGFNCRCSNMYCAVHRYSDKHDCQFDYRSAARDAIAKANPVVKAEKLDKI